ncbi:hypothetical protein GCM10010421_42720 [Streptomyces glaucus]|uniref:Secreted protein n=1 Tax=Streptomyces glaucus TaxID=284029 RepID=A0ABP5XCN4_9ACTN
MPSPPAAPRARLLAVPARRPAVAGRSGRRTANNPCEADANGAVTVRRGAGYARRTHRIPACFGLDDKLDLGRSGCARPKP